MRRAAKSKSNSEDKGKASKSSSSGGSTSTDWDKHDYDYDCIVIGCGSAGLHFVLELPHLDKRPKVLCVDWTVPSPRGNTWTLGGSCLHVGCIPKFLMHHSALAGEVIASTYRVGWPKPTDLLPIDWKVLTKDVQNIIEKKRKNLKKSIVLNEETAVEEFIFGAATFVDEHTLRIKNPLKEDFEEVTVTGNIIVIAVGKRPSIPSSVEGADKYAVTTDDIWTLDHPPGNTLVVGMGFAGIELGGFLAGLGFQVTILNRDDSFFTDDGPNFDKDCMERVRKSLIAKGVRLLYNSDITKIEKSSSGYDVTWEKLKDGGSMTRHYDTVLFCTGHNKTHHEVLKPEVVGLELADDGSIIVDDYDRTNVENIYAIGDIVKDHPEFVSTAHLRAHCLAYRLFGDSKDMPDFSLIPRVVFSPIECGAIGLSEPAAVEKYGADGIKVYEKSFTPMEFEIRADMEPDESECYVKVVCEKKGEQKVVGLHYFGLNAADVLNGFTVAMRLGMTYNDLVTTPFLHPSNGSNFFQCEEIEEG